MSSNILNFLDNEGRIKVWPSKKEMKHEVLKYLAEKFEFGQFYKEQEINNIIDNWHMFNDYFLFRRGLIDNRFLSRTKNGAKYWREEYTSFYLYQNLVCDYFYQYYHSKYKNKHILLENAMCFHEQCKVLDNNIEKYA